MARPDHSLPVRGAIAAGALALGALVTGAATASTARRMAAAPRPVRPTAVRAVEGDRIVFRATPDALLPGRYSFWFAEGRGHARVGDVLEARGDTVVRELLGVDNGDIAAARDGRFNGWFLLGPEGLGLPWRAERVQTTQGAVPAWVVPAPPRRGPVRWAVLVHGRSSVRQETLRAVATLVAAGCTVIVPAYRGDGEAPPADAPRYAVTDAEWVDVESAVLHALDGGAEEVVLVGWSSGASIVLATAARSRVRSVVSAIVLDSPVLDGTAALLARAGAAPEPVRRGALGLLTGRWGSLLGADDLDLDPASRADPAELDVPVLVLQSEDDGVAPMSVARGFAEARPDLVHLVPFVGARHTRLWNLDRERWEGAVTALLAGDDATLGALSATPAAIWRRADRSRRAAGRRATRQASPS